MRIIGGRHPVLESVKGDMVPNDAHLAASGPCVQIITGPNMGGALRVVWPHPQPACAVLVPLQLELRTASGRCVGASNRVSRTKLAGLSWSKLPVRV